MPVSVTSMRRVRTPYSSTEPVASEHDVAFVRELDGIADEVHDDLAQAARVAARHHGHVGADVDDELDALHGRLQGHGRDRLVDHVARIEVRRAPAPGDRPRSWTDRAHR